MALALRKLLVDTSEIRNASRATAHMYIESPLNQASGLRGTGFAGLFSTHPPLEERIRRLEEAGGFHLAPS
jgi:heat shock protein HtpX